MQQLQLLLSQAVQQMSCHASVYYSNLRCSKQGMHVDIAIMRNANSTRAFARINKHTHICAIRHVLVVQASLRACDAAAINTC
jgi:hypothetical protein